MNEEAAVSIAEIEAGSALAPAAAGGRGWTVAAAILCGPLVGGALLFLAMLLGARTRRGGMDCAKVPFGRAGGGFFAALNLLQLVGWTAVMVAQGAGAAGELLGPRAPFGALCAGIGALVAIWIYIGLRGVGRINSVSMALLFALTVVLSVALAAGGGDPAAVPVPPMEGPVFWFAFEMSAAMPLSWLPLAADYTKDARRPAAASAAAALVYSLVSCWMYGVGLLSAASFGADSTFAGAMRSAGLGIAALLVVVFSTVTTTFLDAYSAGESARSLWSRIPAKPFGVAVCAVGTVLAARGAMETASSRGGAKTPLTLRGISSRGRRASPCTTRASAGIRRWRRRGRARSAFSVGGARPRGPRSPRWRSRRRSRCRRPSQGARETRARPLPSRGGRRRRAAGGRSRARR